MTNRRFRSYKNEMRIQSWLEKNWPDKSQIPADHILETKMMLEYLSMPQAPFIPGLPSQEDLTMDNAKEAGQLILDYLLENISDFEENTKKFYRYTIDIEDQAILMALAGVVAKNEILRLKMVENEWWVIFSILIKDRVLNKAN